MKEILEYIYSDYYRYTGHKPSLFKLIFEILLARNHCFTYSAYLRLSSKPNPLYYFARIKHWRLSRIYGIQIPPHTQIGYGFYIGHGINIVINGGTKIGNNVNISQGLTIGTNHRTPATIGDNVYIGPSVCIIEDVLIGDNATIGAGSVVTKDVPKEATVAGVPTKILNYNTPGRYIQNRWISPLA